MNYQKHYNSLIERAQNRAFEGYTEKHHVIPKCLGGSNRPENLARLTAEEHFVAHQLLVKLYPNVGGLAYAAMFMTTHDTVRRVNNKYYGWLKKRVALATSVQFKGTKRPPRSSEWCAKISASKKGHAGWSHTEETKHKVVESNKRRIVSDETRIKMSKVHKAMPQTRKDAIGVASKISRESELKAGTGMYSAESILKRSASIKASWDKRRAKLKEGIL
jgi:hypothetical protein